jgi:hypothetical protein
MSAPRWYRVAALSPPRQLVDQPPRAEQEQQQRKRTGLPPHPPVGGENNQHSSNNDSSSIQSIGSFGSDGVVVMDVVPTRVHPTGAAASTCR